MDGAISYNPYNSTSDPVRAVRAERGANIEHISEENKNSYSFFGMHIISFFVLVRMAVREWFKRIV